MYPWHTHPGAPGRPAKFASTSVEMNIGQSRKFVRGLVPMTLP